MMGGSYIIQAQQDGQPMYKRNIEVRSRNHCCHGKETSITYSECACSLSYSAYKGNAPYYIVISGLSGSTLFFQDFREKSF